MASVSKVIHTDNQLHPGQFGKAAYTEWIRPADLDEGGAPGSFDYEYERNGTGSNALLALPSGRMRHVVHRHPATTQKSEELNCSGGRD